MDWTTREDTPTGDFPVVGDGSVRLADDRPMWLVECRDIANRPCVVTVLVDGDRVVIVGPPGETAVFSSSEVETLRNALREAASAAARHDTALVAGRQR